jgi:hypothetical protein
VSWPWSFLVLVLVLAFGFLAGWCARVTVERDNAQPVTRDEFYRQLIEGIDLGHVSPVTCVTHEGVAWTEDEDAELEQGFDPCAHVVRLWR